MQGKVFLQVERSPTETSGGNQGATGTVRTFRNRRDANHEPAPGRAIFDGFVDDDDEKEDEDEDEETTELLRNLSLLFDSRARFSGKRALQKASILQTLILNRSLF